MPPKVPVINLLILVEGNSFIYCINQSKPMINKSAIDIRRFIFIPKINKTIVIISPTKTPVHLAHTGN